MLGNRDDIAGKMDIVHAFSSPYDVVELSFTEKEEASASSWLAPS